MSGNLRRGMADIGMRLRSMGNVDTPIPGLVPIRLDRLATLEGRYLATMRGSDCRLFALLRVHAPETSFEETKLDYSGAVKITLQHQRLKGLMEGLHKQRIPFMYSMIVKPSDQSDVEANKIFEFDLVLGTWVDTHGHDLEDARIEVERHASTLASTVSVGLSNTSVERLINSALSSFAQTFFMPGDVSLPQVGDASMMSALQSYEGHGPSFSPVALAPEFYIPNSEESGTQGEGILLGKVKGRTNTEHNFSLQLEDLGRHVSIIGMSGAGKSNSASVIVRQVAQRGIPVMVLDWHNEHADMIKEVGGTVFSPGMDSFAVNPLDMGVVSDPSEHVELVTEIFSDTYHFSHPQAYMMRNAMQKCMMESKEGKAPTLSALVSTIEGFPLRSNYDNETKVALLRRLTPLTEGNVGRAFNSPSTHPIEELLDKVICVELGYIKNTQTRAIFANILMKLIYEMRVTGRAKKRKEHLLVIEEARNIVPMRRQDDPPSVGERMVSELRKFGEAIIIVAQFPSQVALEVIKNSGVRIIHKVTSTDDMHLTKEAMNLTKEQLAYVPCLGVGEAVVSMSRLQKPILVQVDSGSPTD